MVTVTAPAAQAAVVLEFVSTLTRLDPGGSGSLEIATRKLILPGSVGFARAPPLKPPAMRRQPSPGLGPVTVHPAHSGVGPRSVKLVSMYP